MCAGGLTCSEKNHPARDHEEIQMGDCGELERLIRAGYSCISIVTHEETYALETVGTVALNLNCPLS